jgi:hypothetical protein
VEGAPSEFVSTVSVAFTLEGAEWGRAMKAAELAEPRARWLRPALWTLPFLAPLPFIVATVLGAGSLSEVFGALVPWELLALMWPLMYEFSAQLFSRLHLRRMRRGGEELVFEERGLSERALWVRGNWDTTYLPWLSIASVKETSEFLLFRGPTDTYFIPKRLLGDHELAEVRRLVSTCGPATIQPAPPRGRVTSA